jgi:hypothetical protein
MRYHPVGIEAGTSSFDIEPAATLDPTLFEGTHLKDEVRQELLLIISKWMHEHYQGWQQWLRAWLAGSGASYRWHAATDMKDLDILLGVDFIQFRQSNPDFSRIGDAEIAAHMNEQMRQELWPTTNGWKGQYEVTWYVNPKSQDIRNINPYAAYNLLDDVWTVPPSVVPARVPPNWHGQAALYADKATTAVTRYAQALNELQSATNPYHRRDAEVRFQAAVDSAVALYDSVHQSRRTAFTPTGGGYSDFTNFLWQMGKRAGWIPALKKIKDYREQALASAQAETYGMELPDVGVLLRRALMRR